MLRTSLRLGLQVIALLLVIGSVRSVGAQMPPARYFGFLTIDGVPAPPGTEVITEINGRVCSRHRAFPHGGGINYSVDAESHSTIPGCGRDGDTVFFRVGNRYALQTAVYTTAAFVRLDLTILAQRVPPPVTPAVTIPPVVTPVVTTIVPPAPATELVALLPGCNNVALTWPPGTPMSTIAAAITPAGALQSIFLYLTAVGRFIGYAPNVPSTVVDLPATPTRLATVFICVTTPATLARPV